LSNYNNKKRIIAWGKEALSSVTLEKEQIREMPVSIPTVERCRREGRITVHELWKFILLLLFLIVQ
jgi:hypothetical protein